MGIPVHELRSRRGPFAERILGDANDSRCVGGPHVEGQRFQEKAAVSLATRGDVIPVYHGRWRRETGLGTAPNFSGLRGCVHAGFANPNATRRIDLARALSGNNWPGQLYPKSAVNHFVAELRIGNNLVTSVAM